MSCKNARHLVGALMLVSVALVVAYAVRVTLMSFGNPGSGEFVLQLTFEFAAEILGLVLGGFCFMLAAILGGTLLKTGEPQRKESLAWLSLYALGTYLIGGQIPVLNMPEPGLDPQTIYIFWATPFLALLDLVLPAWWGRSSEPDGPA